MRTTTHELALARVQGFIAIALRMQCRGHLSRGKTEGKKDVGIKSINSTRLRQMNTPNKPIHQFLFQIWLNIILELEIGSITKYYILEPCLWFRAPNIYLCTNPAYSVNFHGKLNCKLSSHSVREALPAVPSYPNSRKKRGTEPVRGLRLKLRGIQRTALPFFLSTKGQNDLKQSRAALTKQGSSATF